MQLVDALVCSEPGHLRLERRPAPIRAEGQVLVRPLRVGICGTDYHIFEGKHPFLEYPRVMGHELAVEIVDAPDNSPLRPGEVCVVNPYLSCGQCVACRNGKPNCCVRISVLGVHQDGGMAELLSVPVGNLIPAPDLSPDQCATVEFLAIGAHAVRRGAVWPRIGFSSSGPARSASELRSSPGIRGRPSSPSTGPPTVRRARALSPAWTPSRPTRARLTSGFPDGAGFDAVFDATGSPRAMERSFDYVAHGGRLVLVSVVKEPITFMDPDFHRKEMTLLRKPQRYIGRLSTRHRGLRRKSDSD